MRADKIKRKETARAAQAYLESATTSAGWLNPATLIEEAEQAIFALLTDKTGNVAKQVIVERACLCEAVGNALTEALTLEASQSRRSVSNLVKLADAIVRTSVAQARLHALASAIQVKGDGDPNLSLLPHTSSTLKGDALALEVLPDEGDSELLEVPTLEPSPEANQNAN